MSSALHQWCRHLGLPAVIMFALLATPALAREAAFMDPGSSGGSGGNPTEAIRVEPKSEIDIGDSALNVARRTTLFFTNQTGAPIKIEKIAINSDSNVTAEIANDDCTKQGTLMTGSRCSVEVSITPSSGGSWSVEILMTHNGIGRITRAKIAGKTSGGSTGDKKDAGLFLSNKDVKPIDFGEVEIGQGKTVRSALMVNDSPEAITLYSIDVIEADNGLERLDQGCAVDMELKPGESCPVTMVWTPATSGHISTDLIIRHSGRLGFAVIPIRGTTKGQGTGGSTTSASSDKYNTRTDPKGSSIPLPPSPNVDSIAAALPQVASSSLATPGGFHLIGTVGMRGLFYKPDGTTVVAQKGDEVDLGTNTAKIIAISAKSAEVTISGKKKTLPLESASALTDKARSIKSNAAPAVSKGFSGNTMTPIDEPSLGSGR